MNGMARVVVSMGVLAASALLASAATKTTAGSGYWTNGATWGGSVPVSGDDAVVAGGHSVTVDVSVASLASLTNIGTLTFVGWSNTVVTATVITVNGTITHLPQSDTNGADGWMPDHRIRIVCSNLFVASSGAISANGKGYLGGVAGTTGTNGSRQGRGPGGGAWSMGGGGGYGGWGGVWNNSTYPGGATYGSAIVPEDPGSGAGYQNGYTGSGGGAIWIEATGLVVVNGTVTANGETAGNSGGAGGSIHVVCDTFYGTNGMFSATGGNGNYSGGGGGRIAVNYANTTAQGAAPIPSVLFSTAPGYSPQPHGIGDIGTLYFPDNRFLTETVRHSGQWMVPNFTNWAPDSLTISNSWFRFVASDFSLTVTQSIMVLGGGVPSNRLDLTPSLISCGGDLTLTNRGGATSGSYLYLLASSNSVPGMDGCGPRVTVGGAFTISSNSVVYPYSHPTNGCGIGFQMGNLTVARGGSINANALGCRGGTNTGDSGKGRGGSLAGNLPGGAGYGGAGGIGFGGTLPGGSPYGSSNAPIDSGSGSGFSSFYSSSGTGAAGGGLIRLVAGNRVVLDGTITANGIAPAVGSSGSSGGGIYIYCRSFAGVGSLSAQGGNGGGNGSGGGGGRIAVWRTTDTSALSSTNVAGGINGGVSNGEPGTIVWVTTRPAGTIFVVH